MKNKSNNAKKQPILRSLARFLPAVCFLILLILGIIMLYPGRYHDGAAGRAVCVIGGAGVGWYLWSFVQQAIALRQRGGGSGYR